MNCRRAKNYIAHYYKYEYICIPSIGVTWVIPTTLSRPSRRRVHTKMRHNIHVHHLRCWRFTKHELSFHFVLHSFLSPITVFGDFFVHSKWKECVSPHLKLPNYVRRVRSNIYFENSRISISTWCSVWPWPWWGVRVHEIYILQCIQLICDFV